MYSVCILIYVSLYLYRYPSTHGIPGLAPGGAWEEIQMRLKMMIESTQRYTPRPWWREDGDGQQGHNRAFLEIHLEAVMKWTEGCTPRSWSTEFVDTLGDHDRVNKEMRSKIVIERVCTHTWRPSSCELQGSNRASVDEYLEAVERWRTGCWDCFHQSISSQPWDCEKLTLLLSSHGEVV